MGRYLRTTVRRAAPALCSLLALASVGCSRSTDRAQAKDSTITLLYPIGSGPRVLGYYAPSSLIFLPLVSRNAAGELEGRLARSWEHSPDYRTWTIHLRTDVRWHDGVPVTAHDVKFTLDLRQHPDVLWEPAGAYTVTVLDDYTYTIAYHRKVRTAYRYKLPTSPLSTVVFAKYWPKHLLEELDPKEFFQWEFWTHPVGNGPYRYVRHVPQTMIEFVANPDYYRGKPRIERVVLKLGASSITELLSGNVDFIMYVNATDRLTLAGDPRFRVYHNPSGAGVVAIYWNQRHPPFRDRKVRRALTLAINRRELGQVLNYPEGSPISDVIYTSRQLQRGELPEPLPYDPEAAKQVLDAAGWRDLDGDGIRERDGTQFRFTMLSSGSGSVGVGRRLGEQASVYVQDQFARVGVKMDILILDRPAGSVRFRAGDFEAAIWTNTGAGEGYPVVFGEGSPIGYANPTVIELLKAIQATMNPDEHDRIYRKLWPIFQADLPITGIHPFINTYVAHRRVRGLSPPFRPSAFHGIDDLWLEDEP